MYEGQGQRCITFEDYQFDDTPQELSKEQISSYYMKLKILETYLSIQKLSQELQEAKRKELLQKIFQENKAKRQPLNNKQKSYLSDINKNARVKYYKKEYRLSLPTHMFFPKKDVTNARTSFQQIKQVIQQSFKECSMCSLTIKTYGALRENPIIVYEGKLNRIQREIASILRRDCYRENVELIFYNNYQAIPIEMRQYIHIVLKIPIQSNIEKMILDEEFSATTNKKRWIKIQVANPKRANKEYLSVANNAYCNSVSGWSIGYRVKNQNKEEYHTYFQPQGQYFIAFSRSMYDDQDEKSKIKEICIYNSFDSSIALKTVIKKQQIYQINYSPNKQDLYIFLSSPPDYEFAVIPPNTYCQPNYLGYYERCQNFLLMDHRDLKDNDFLRLYLYSNSYIHIKLNKADTQSCNNICMNIDLILHELNYKENILSSKIQPSRDKDSGIKNFDPKVLEKRFSFIHVPYKPFLTAHLKWKLSYQIMLLIRFNVMGPSDLQDFLRLVEINKDRLEDILECLRICSSGFTNKVAGLNRFKENVYQQFKRKIFDFLVTQKQDQNSKKRSEENSCWIYKVSLTPSGVLPNPISKETKCRLIREYQSCSDFFLKVTLMDDNGQAMKNKNYIYDRVLRKYLDQITFLGKKYLPLGWSGSQLKSGSLWYVSEIPKDQFQLQLMTRQSILKFLGNFDNIPIAAKKAARIGQALSSSYWYNSENVKVVQVKDDLSQKKYLFTDGIGKISKELFNDIRQEFQNKGIRFNCCLQIRYKGAKGVVLLNDQLQGRSMVLRESMVKYQCKEKAAQKYLDILNWDKYLPGFLNRQIIILLRSLNIQDTVFLQFQRKYIEKLNQLNLQEMDGSLFAIFNNQDESEDSFPLTIKSLTNCFDISKDLFFHHFLQNFKDNKFKELKQKSRISIQKSARLIGVIDDYKILNQKELYCCIQKPTQQRPYVVSGPVIITRNPSLDPADVRKCKCVSQQQVRRRFQAKGYKDNHFQNYINCIVFPKQGNIPLTAQISGSDLDGDIFFISWQEKFIINDNKPAHTIDNPNQDKPKPIGRPNYTQMLDFFVSYLNNEALGKINNAHLVLADKSPHFANDQDCLKLANIHGKVVDYAKSGEMPQRIPPSMCVREYPDFFQKWNKPSYTSTSILGKLYRQCLVEIKKRNRVNANKRLNLDEELLRCLPLQSVDSNDVDDILHVLVQFQRSIVMLLCQFGFFSQFQLYSGSNVDNAEAKNEFGRKRLANELQRLRQRCQLAFFDEDHSEYEKYRQLKSPHLKRNLRFEDKTVHKAVLAYIISYFCFCNREDSNAAQDIKRKDLQQLFSQMKTSQKHMGYKGHYLGFVWLVVPKIMINIKYSKGKA